MSSTDKKEVKEKLYLSAKRRLKIPEIGVFAEETIGPLCDENITELPAKIN